MPRLFLTSNARVLLATLVIAVIIPLSANAQVDDIKQKSAEHSQNSSGSGGSNSSAGYSSSDNSDISLGQAIAGDVLAEVIIFIPRLVLVTWQEEKLKQEETNPNISSLEVMFQAALQPSIYSIVTPRIRGVWGLYSTDFRMSYLIESDIDGTKTLRTDDWQILQLNLLTAHNATFRVGGGILHENFNDDKVFAEWSVGLHILSNNERIGGMLEHRWSEPRDEWNGHLSFRLVNRGRFSMYGTAGAMFQRYYDTIKVWGLQGGLMFRIN